MAITLEEGKGIFTEFALKNSLNNLVTNHSKNLSLSTDELLLIAWPHLFGKTDHISCAIVAAPQVSLQTVPLDVVQRIMTERYVRFGHIGHIPQYMLGTEFPTELDPHQPFHFMEKYLPTSPRHFLNILRSIYDAGIDLQKL